MVLNTNKDLIMPSTTKEIIEVTQLNMQKARHAQIEMLNKLNKGKNPFLIPVSYTHLTLPTTPYV